MSKSLVTDPAHVDVVLPEAPLLQLNSALGALTNAHVSAAVAVTKLVQESTLKKSQKDAILGDSVAISGLSNAVLFHAATGDAASTIQSTEKFTTFHKITSCCTSVARDLSPFIGAAVPIVTNLLSALATSAIESDKGLTPEAKAALIKLTSHGMQTVSSAATTALSNVAKTVTVNPIVKGAITEGLTIATVFTSGTLTAPLTDLLSAETNITTVVSSTTDAEVALAGAGTGTGIAEAVHL